MIFYCRSLSEIEANFKNINKNILWIGIECSAPMNTNDDRLLFLQGRLFTTIKR